ncbi:MAG: DNA repair protein RecN [Clostridiaceae bacterium]|nr:DNA repair protein RecN [Clostridiaceae bacterium]
MLVQLNIKNIALIDYISIEFKPNMNCLTGETGAGKSIIIDSIGCVLGGRTSRDTIRTGADSGSVEAVFYVNEPLVSEKLKDLGIEEEEDHTLLLFREITSSGRNICRINGRIVTLSMLREIGEVLIDIHGQHDNQSLMRVNSHILLLDMYAGDKLGKVLAEYGEKLSKFKEVHNALDRLAGDPKERERTIDLLKYQIDEIESARLHANEDEELRIKKNVLSNMERIVTSLNDAYVDLKAENSVLDKLENAMHAMSRIEGLGEGYKEILSRIEAVFYEVEDIANAVRNEKDNMDLDMSELDSIEERLDMINRLKRKYGGTIEDILRYRDVAQEKLNELLDSEYMIEKYTKEMDKLAEELFELCKKLDESRRSAAVDLSEKIAAQLHDLEMKNATFEVKIDFDESINELGYPNFKKNGLNDVEFLVSANLGEPTKPLARIASGGELSRIMLAIKTILADVDNIPTLIFDEIDIGISGQAARKVGEKMKLISKKHQVICVTHLAQIAAIADNNVYISKTTVKDKTVTEAKTLGFEEKVEEVGRLLDGNAENEITKAHARKMIEEYI